MKAHLSSFQNGRCIGPTLANEPEALLSQNSLTRKAGGRKPLEKEMQVMLPSIIFTKEQYYLLLLTELLRCLLLHILLGYCGHERIHEQSS